MSRPTPRRQIVLAITGASGAAYAVRLVEVLRSGGVCVHLAVSSHGRRLLRDELGIDEITPETFGVATSGELVVYPFEDVGARIASGSFVTGGMIICPCSSNTLGAIAAGLGNNLVTRAAAVTLKEGRRLVLVTREMPASAIDLENALRLSRAGAVICPASPGFYMNPKTIEDLVDFVVGRVCDLVGVRHGLNTRWAEPSDDTQQTGGNAPV